MLQRRVEQKFKESHVNAAKRIKEKKLSHVHSQKEDERQKAMKRSNIEESSETVIGPQRANVTKEIRAVSNMILKKT